MISPFWCGWHTERTPPDQDGVQICLRCGAPIEPPDPIKDIRNAMESLRRSPHLMSCVHVEGNVYICSKNCPEAREDAR